MTNLPEVTLHPGERAIFKLPWRGSSGANYDWLKAICGERTRPKYDSESKSFLVARPHAQYVIDALVKEYGRVKVMQFGHTATTCVEQCWNAKIETIAECECGCAGSNHGSGRPLDTMIQSGLSVQQEFTKATYVVTASGRTLLVL